MNVSTISAVEPAELSSVRALAYSNPDLHLPLCYRLAVAPRPEELVCYSLPEGAGVMISNGHEWVVALKQANRKESLAAAADALVALAQPGQQLTAVSSVADTLAAAWTKASRQRATLSEVCDYMVVRKSLISRPDPDISAVQEKSAMSHQQAVAEMAICWAATQREPVSLKAFEASLGNADALLCRKLDMTTAFMVYTLLFPGSGQRRQHILMGSCCGEPEQMSKLFARLVNMPCKVGALVSRDNCRQQEKLVNAGFVQHRGLQFSTYDLC